MKYNTVIVNMTITDRKTLEIFRIMKDTFQKGTWQINKEKRVTLLEKNSQKNWPFAEDKTYKTNKNIKKCSISLIERLKREHITM